MKNVGGPKNPDATQKVVGGKLVQLRPVEKKDEAKTVEIAPVPHSDEFGGPKIQTGGITIPEVVDEATRGANVRARLAALGKGNVPIKDVRSDQVKVREGSGGKIVEGSLTVESPKGLAKLEGVVRISGDLTVQETRLAGGDVTPVNTLVEIGGRLTIEGVSS